MGEPLGPSATATDEELVMMIVAGKGEVFAQIYERYYSRAYRLGYGMTGSHSTAEELVQEIFIRAYQKLGLFRGKSSFATWFYRLASNHCLNYCRSRKRVEQREGAELERLIEPADNTTMESVILQSELQGEIQRALFSLKPKLRLIVILRDIEGWSYEEIAERLNCSTATLGSQLKRARTLLARKLKHLRGTV